MSQSVQKLLNKSLHSRIATHFHHRNPQQFPTFPAVDVAAASASASYTKFTPNPISPPKSDGRITHFNGFQIYPSFSFAHFLNPISPLGLFQSEPAEGQEVGVESDESKMIWADSVKKKRKRKMNKHKLKKLRKRLRHCS